MLFGLRFSRGRNNTPPHVEVVLIDLSARTIRTRSDTVKHGLSVHLTLSDLVVHFRKFCSCPWSTNHLETLVTCLAGHIPFRLCVPEPLPYSWLPVPSTFENNVLVYFSILCQALWSRRFCVQSICVSGIWRYWVCVHVYRTSWCHIPGRSIDILRVPPECAWQRVRHSRPSCDWSFPAPRTWNWQLRP